VDFHATQEAAWRWQVSSRLHAILTTKCPNSFAVLSVQQKLSALSASSCYVVTVQSLSKCTEDL
jgi:hypothetical protein